MPYSEVTSDTLSSDKISNVQYVNHVSNIHTEQWRKVPDWPYEVSNFGRVRRLERVPGTRAGVCLAGGTCGPKGTKYPNIMLRDSPRSWTLARHQLVALVFLGPTPSGMEIDHKDGNRFNCRL